MSKYSVVTETLNSTVHHSILKEGVDRPLWNGRLSAPSTPERIFNYVATVSQMLLLSHAVGATSREEMIQDAQDHFRCVQTLCLEVVNVNKNIATPAHKLRSLINHITRLEGAYSLYSLAEEFSRGKKTGMHLDDISVEISIIRDYQIKLEAFINAYHGLDDRLLDVAASTSSNPVYFDGMRVVVTMRGEFLDQSMYPLLRARLNIMKGEPLASLSKQSLLIKPDLFK